MFPRCGQDCTRRASQLNTCHGMFTHIHTHITGTLKLFYLSGLLFSCTDFITVWQQKFGPDVEFRSFQSKVIKFDGQKHQPQLLLGDDGEISCATGSMTAPLKWSHQLCFNVNYHVKQTKSLLVER